MSDIFDHAADAYGELFLNEREENYIPHIRNIPLRNKYTRLPLINELSRTDKAVMLVVEYQGRHLGTWFPLNHITFPYADYVDISDWMFKQKEQEWKYGYKK